MIPVEIIDSHQHFWRYDSKDHDWMTAAMGVLKRDHLPGELATLLPPASVSGTVAVQARRLDQETLWLLELAAEHRFILGVVGWLNVASPDLDAALERLSGDPKLVGMREVVHDMPDPDYCASPAHRRAVGVVFRHGLSYDLLLRPANLAAALELVDAYPQGRFVVDHIAKPDMRRGGASEQSGASPTRGAAEPANSPAGEPGRWGHRSAGDAPARSEMRRAWEQGLRALAERDNVACKLSGLVTECDWSSWREDDITPYLDIVLEAFGAERCLLGSDWPVCTLAASYQAAVGLVAGYASRLSPNERTAILAGAARSWYRLKATREEEP